jgi:hypothetical protein
MRRYWLKIALTKQNILCRTLGRAGPFARRVFEGRQQAGLTGDFSTDLPRKPHKPIKCL